MAFVTCTTLHGHSKLVPQASLSFRPTVYAVILHERQVLLITTRSTGKYYFPGGGIELGERMEDALTREVREETGRDVRIDGLLHVEEQFFFHDPTAEAWHALLFFFRCTPREFHAVGSEQIDTSEVAAVHWHDVDSLQPHHFQQAAHTVVHRLRSLLPPP